MTEEIIEVVTRVKIMYDETKEGRRQEAMDAAVAENATGYTGLNSGTYTIKYLPGGQLISPRPVKPPDHMLVPKLRDRAMFLRSLEEADCVSDGELYHVANLVDEACEALANASGQMCDIAEYHTEKYFKLWAQRDELVKALKAMVLLIETDYGGFDAVPEWQKAVATLKEAGVRD